NLGVPFISAVTDSWDWGVIEISSFQLEWVEQFRPRIALLLTRPEDHLDRYASFADYGSAKERIFAAQQSGDVAILNRDDSLVWKLRERVAGRGVFFCVRGVGGGVGGGRRGACSLLRCRRSRRGGVRNVDRGHLARRLRRRAVFINQRQDP